MTSVPSRNSPFEQPALVRRAARRHPARAGSGVQSGLPNHPSLGISWIIRKPRTARSTIVAVTSSMFARSSIRVPIWPGRMPSGGANSTGADAPPSNTAARPGPRPSRSPSPGRPGRPSERRSRPPRHQSAPRPPSSSASSPTPPGTVTRCRRERSARTTSAPRGSGLGSGRRPVGQSDDHRHPFVRRQGGVREPRRFALASWRPARSVGTDVAGEAEGPIDGGGGQDPHGGSIDRSGPFRTDRVPVQLVVRGEAVQCSLDAVDDLVGVDARDRDVGVADPDPCLPVGRSTRPHNPRACRASPRPTSTSSG